MEKLNAELAKVVSEARKHRGGKPAKYPGLEKYGESIVKLLDSDVQLPYILKWLIEEKKEVLVLNTLRKYVILKIGRGGYEDYLKRNGWMKSKRAVAPAAAPRLDGGETRPMTPPGPETKPAPFKQPNESSIDYAALAAGLKTETTNNGFMKMPGEPEVQTGKAGAKTK